MGNNCPIVSVLGPKLAIEFQDRRWDRRTRTGGFTRILRNIFLVPRPWTAILQFTVEITQPFQCYSPVTIAPGESYHINDIDIDIPADKAVIIEYVSGYGEMPLSQKLTNVSVYTWQFPQRGQEYAVPHFFIPVFTGNYNGILDNYVVSARTFLYHSTERIRVQANRTGTHGTAGFNFALSGRFVDLPTNL